MPISQIVSIEQNEKYMDDSPKKSFFAMLKRFFHKRRQGSGSIPLLPIVSNLKVETATAKPITRPCLPIKNESNNNN